MDETGQMRECAICCNDTAVAEVIFMEGDSACYGCIRDVFRFAVESEENYPPVWAGQPLQLEDYAYILDAGLVGAYKRKTEEYAIAWSERVVCKRSERHGHGKDVFVGKSQLAQQSAPCPECGLLYCLRCSQDVAEHDAERHSCKKSEPTPGLQALKQGKDYQLCPSCKSAVQLQDGCNHIVCVCTQQFCFICGQPAMNNSNHWVRGRCPRYNRAGTGAPMWQEDIDEFMLRHRQRQAPRWVDRLLPRILRDALGRRDHERRERTRQARATRAARTAAEAALELSRQQLGQLPRQSVTSSRRQATRQEQGQQRAGPMDAFPHVIPAQLPTHPRAEDAPKTTASVRDRSRATDHSSPRAPLSATTASDDRLAGTRLSIGGSSQPYTPRMEDTMLHPSPMHQTRPSHAKNQLLASALQADIAALSSSASNEDRARASLQDVWLRARTDFQPSGGDENPQSLSIEGSLLDHQGHVRPQHTVIGTISVARDHQHAHHAGRSTLDESSPAQHDHAPSPAVETDDEFLRFPFDGESDLESDWESD